MSYNAKQWKSGDVITADALNNIENGIKSMPNIIQGPKGEQGPIGIQGKDGTQGIQGPAGPQGIPGKTGDKGDTGATGAQGPTGPKGDPGVQGPKGDKGDSGNTVNDIPDGTSLNSLTSIGNYSCGSNKAIDSPVTSWFTLVVIKNGDFNGSQTLTDTNTGQVWTRSWSSSTKFTEWKMLATDNEVVKIEGKQTIHDDKVFDGSVMFKGGIKAVDLGVYHADGIKSSGLYKVYGNIEGLPISPAYGILEVSSNDTDTFQRFTQTNVDVIHQWERILNDNISGWTQWQSITSAATLKTDEIVDDVSLVDIEANKSLYTPYERAEFSAHTNTNIGKLRIKYWKREILVNTQYVAFETSPITWSWYIPSDDNEQYILEVELIGHSGATSRPYYIAVNVSTQPNNIPLMGFLSSYNIYNPNKQLETMKFLKRLHINYIQYYECGGRPENIGAVSDGEPGISGTANDWWTDLSRAVIRKDVLLDYIRLGHEFNIKNMLYIPWGNTSYTDEAHGIKPEMLLYNDSEKGKNHDLSAVEATLDGGEGKWAAWPLMKANPLNTSYKNLIFWGAMKALKAMGYDGIHIDTLGAIFDGSFDSSGYAMSNDIASHRGMPLFINDIADYFNKDSIKKTGSNVRFGFNNVGNWGLSDLANNQNLDYLYAEQWNDSYQDLFSASRHMIELDNRKRAIIPAYIHKNDNGAPKKEFNLNTVALVDSIIMSTGATHLEMGEDMLCSEYFPNRSVVMGGDVKDWIVKFYDFQVAYRRMFQMGNFTSTVFSVNTPLSVNSIDITKLSAVEQSDDFITSVSLINTKGLNSDAWRDIQQDRNKPDKLTNVGLGFNFKPKAVYYATIEDPVAKPLTPDANNYVFVPEVDRYTLVYAYK